MLSERGESGLLGGAGTRGEGGLGYSYSLASSLATSREGLASSLASSREGLASGAMELQRRVTGAGKRKGLNPVKQVTEQCRQNS